MWRMSTVHLFKSDFFAVAFEIRYIIMDFYAILFFKYDMRNP